MKILYITPGCFDKGGISRYNRYQIQMLRNLYGEGQIRVLSLLGPDEHSFEDEINVYWHGNGISFKDKFSLVNKVFSLAFAWKPNVIWLGHVNLSGMGWLAAALSRATSVLNVYGLEIWSSMSKDAALGLKKVNHIIADCHNTADYLIQKKIRVKGDIDIIWDCVDIDRFKPAADLPTRILEKYKIPDPRKYFNVLSLGRLSKPDAFYKGYDRLLEAVVALCPEYPRLRLVFAGRGNYRKDLEEMARQKGIQEFVSFTGSVDEEDLAIVYQSCHVFSLITESGEGKGEGIPLTPLEAMACGKPILVGNQDGSREAIIANSNGFSLSPHDLDLHRSIIRRYLNEPILLATQSRAAAEQARKYFSYERFAAETKAFIDQKLMSSEK